MRLTRQTEIAISILISCARRQTVIDTELAADEAQATKDHAAQVLKRMVQAGWIETRRGRGGGLSLKTPAENLSLGAVVATMQPASLGRAGGSSDITETLQPVLKKASETVLDLLDCYTIADLAQSCPQRKATLKRTDQVSAKRFSPYPGSDATSRHMFDNASGSI